MLQNPLTMIRQTFQTKETCNLRCSCHQWFSVGRGSVHSTKKAGTLADSHHLSTAGNNLAFPTLWSLSFAVMHLFCSFSLFSSFAVGATSLHFRPHPVSIMTSWDCVVFWHFAPAERLIISLPLRWWCRNTTALLQLGLSFNRCGFFSFFFALPLYFSVFPIWISNPHPFYSIPAAALDRLLLWTASSWNCGDGQLGTPGKTF